MKTFKLIVPFCAFAAGIILLAFKPFPVKDHWKQLFNGKDLAGWDTYLGPDLDDSGKPINGQPLGLNNDPRHVFTIVQENGENVIRISGEEWGAITTQKEYENYHLQLQFKWGALTLGSKERKGKRTVVYCIIRLANMAPIMAPGCDHRNSRSRKATPAIIGDVQGV